MFIELLESRIAPAAVLNLTTSGQALKITADSAGDPLVAGVAIDPAGGVDVSSPFTILLNGGATTAGPEGVHLPSVLGGITFNGSALGNNQVTLAPGGVFGGGITMNLGGTNNTVNIEASAIAGSVSITAPAGGTEVNFNGLESTLIGGSLKLTLGNAAVSAGASVVNIAGPEFTVAGSISYVGSPSKLPVGQNTATGNNHFQVSETGLFSVAGHVLFNSRLLPGSISIQAQTLNIAGSLVVEEAGQNSQNPDAIQGGMVNIGGALSWSSTGGQGLNLGGGSLFVGGRVTLNAGTGAGELQIGTETTNIGALTAIGAGLFQDQSSGGLLNINGSVSLSNFGDVNIQSLGTIGGSLRAVNVAQFHLADGFAAEGESLVIGGSIAVTGPGTAHGAAQTAIPGTYAIANAIVGGSYSVTTNSVAPSVVSLADSSIYGSVNLKLQGAVVELLQQSNADQMLIAGALNVTLASPGNQFITQSPTPTDPIVLGPTKIVAPNRTADTFNYTSSLFALPLKIVA